MEGILKIPARILAAIILTVVLLNLSSADEANLKVEIPDEAVSKKILDNGLILLAKESPLPENLVAISIKVNAGSSLEEEYLGSGISHLVEHMVFKGTKTRKAGNIEREVKAMGGIINGSTDQDTTGYSLIVPTQNLKIALSLLKDMLLNASFDPVEFEKEKEVILKELRMDDDEPQNQLARSVFATSYFRHTYKYPPIGYEDKFKSLTAGDAVKYYNRMYVPNKIVIAMAGGISRNDAISAAEAEFKDFRKPDYSLMASSPVEPVQIDVRRMAKPLDTNLAYMAIAFHSTSVSSEDLFATDVLSMILGRGNNSRLNTSLFKDKRLVHSISSWNFTPRDPGLFAITAILDPSKLDEAEEAVRDQIAKSRTEFVTDEELETAKRMVLSDYIFALQAVDAQAEDLAINMILTGSYNFSRRYIKGVQAVSKEDIKRVAGRYLRDDNANIVTVLPRDFKSVESKGAPVSAGLPIRRDIPSNGLKVIVRQNKKTPVVAITVAIGGGLACETKENSGISNLTARMLLKGTAARKESEIAGAIEKLGGSIGPFNGFNSFGINVEFLKPDLDAVLSVLSDIVTDPVFPQEELLKEKDLAIAMIREEDDDIFQRGINALRKEMFTDSPYGFRYLGEEASVISLTSGDLADFYKTYAVPNNMVISVSGDVEPEAVLEKIRASFTGLKTKDLPAKRVTIPKPDKISVKTIEMDKDQSIVLIGFVTSDTKNPDKRPLEVLSSVLSGTSGRLFKSLRGETPIAYALGCAQKMTVDTGFFILYTATTKENIGKAEQILLKEITAIREKGVGEEELLESKRELTTNFSIKTEMNSFVAQNTALDELCGLGYDSLFKYTDEIEKVSKEATEKAADKYLTPDAYSEVIISRKHAIMDR